MDTNAPVLVAAKTLEKLVADIFFAAGCDTEEAGRISTHLLGANLAGHDSHGVARVPRYVEWLEAGYVLKGQTAEIVTDGGTFAIVDGKYGFGQTVAPQAVQLGISRALEHGIAIVGLRKAGHIGRIGDYAETANRAGLVSIHFVNVAGSVLVAPFGAAERRFSTAPFSIGVPLKDKPLVLDFATSLVAEGKVLIASNGGKKLPAGALVEPDGTLSADPHTLYGEYPPIGPRNPANGLGAIRAFGEHKGSGLAFMCEMLAGALTGGGTSGPIDARTRITNGMLSIYLSAKHFGTAEELQEVGLRYVEWVKAARPATPGGEVLVPGEAESRNRADRLANGVPLQPDTWTSILETGKRLGVPSLSDALARYRRDAALRSQIQVKAGEYARPAAIESHAKRLDLWDGTAPVSPNTRATDLLLDLCLYVEAAGQTRGIDLYALEVRPPGGEDGARLLRALREARFGLYRYQQPDPRGGATLAAMGGTDPIWLMDETLPVITPVGMPFFARLARPEDYHVLTGWAIWADAPLLRRAQGEAGGKVDTDEFCIRLFRAHLDLGLRAQRDPE